MLRRIVPWMLMGSLVLAACTPHGDMNNPFVKVAPYAPSAVPADFAIIVDENHDTFYARQHIQQVITAADSMSRTTYTTYSDYNDGVAKRFSQETPLSVAQLQAMWNEVGRDNLMDGSTMWINWISEADLYKRNAFTIQIRANGRTRTYRQTNGFSGAVRQEMLLVDAVRLPMSQDAKTPVLVPTGGGSAMPVREAAPAAPTPAVAPATAPGS